MLLEQAREEGTGASVLAWEESSVLHLVRPRETGVLALEWRCSLSRMDSCGFHRKSRIFSRAANSLSIWKARARPPLKVG